MATIQSFRIEDTEQRNVYAFSEAFEPHPVVVEIALLRRAPKDERLRLAGLHGKTARLHLDTVFKKPRLQTVRLRVSISLFNTPNNSTWQLKNQAVAL